MDWRVFTAGTAVVHFEAAGDLEHVSATADTSGAINLLFHVSDKFQSTFDRNTGCTSEFNKQTVEGRRQVNSTLKMDYTQTSPFWTKRTVTKNQVEARGNAHTRAAYRSATGPVLCLVAAHEVGKSFQIPVVDALQTVTVTMKVEGKEEIKTPLGTFKTVRVQPTADAGVVKNRGNIWIWYTDDERHLPVQMRARLFWGTITFRLAANETK